MAFRMAVAVGWHMLSRWKNLGTSLIPMGGICIGGAVTAVIAIPIGDVRIVVNETGDTIGEIVMIRITTRDIIMEMAASVTVQLISGGIKIDTADIWIHRCQGMGGTDGETEALTRSILYRLKGQ